MEQTKRLELLQELCEIDGVSGCEGTVAQWIQSHLPDNCTARVDARGNLICEKKGRQTPKNKLMFAAHMDEVGFIVTYIEESGLIRFDSVGGVDTRVVVGKPVRLESGKEGVVGAKPIHLQSADEREATLKYSELYIDIGTKSREEAEQFVSLGDFATFRPQFVQMGSCICAKALDDRIGCLLLLELLNEELPYDITAVFTVQEEIGGAASNAAFAVKPDIAIAVDTNTAADVPGVKEFQNVCALGKGPVLTFQDKGGFSDRELFSAAKEICKEQGISYQIKNQIIGATDAAGMGKAAAGCRTLSVAVPTRYIHSPSCVFNPKDLEPTAKLLAAMVERFAQL